MALEQLAIDPYRLDFIQLARDTRRQRMPVPQTASQSKQLLCCQQILSLPVVPKAEDVAYE